MGNENKSKITVVLASLALVLVIAFVVLLANGGSYSNIFSGKNKNGTDNNYTNMDEVEITDFNEKNNISAKVNLILSNGLFNMMDDSHYFYYDNQKIDMDETTKAVTAFMVAYDSYDNKMTSEDVEKLKDTIHKVYGNDVDVSSFVGDTKITALSGDKVNEKYNELFGENIRHQDIVKCPRAYYNETNNIYLVSKECGGGGNPFVFYKQYKYTQKGNEIYVYVGLATYDVENKKMYAGIGVNENKYLYDKELNFITEEDNKVIGNEIYNNYQKYEQYKITFEKKDNNYIYKNTEKISDGQNSQDNSNNANKKLGKQTIGDIEIEIKSLKYENGTTTLETLVTNKGNDDIRIKEILFHVKDASGKEMETLTGFVGNVIKAKEIKTIDSYHYKDLSNYATIECEVVKENSIQTVGNFEIDTKFVKWENGTTTLEAVITNKSDEDVKLKEFLIHLKDSNGKEIATLTGYVGDVFKAHDVKTLNSYYDKDLSNYATLEYEIVKDTNSSGNTSVKESDKGLFEFKNTSAKWENKTFVLETTITNRTDRDLSLKEFLIHIYDKNGKEMLTMTGYVDDVIKAHETKVMDSYHYENLSGYAKVVYEIVE